MPLEKLRGEQTWMSEPESSLRDTLELELDSHFKRMGVAETPLLALRVNDLIASLLLVHRLEQLLGMKDDGQEKRAPQSLTAIADAIGKARERTRKAMKELEDASAKLGTPIGMGIADTLRPLMLQTKGIDEECWRAETEPGDVTED